MTTETFTSRDFNREPSRIKRAAKRAPVIITERNNPDIVVMSYQRYTELTAGTGSFLDRIAMPGLSDVDLDMILPKGGPQAAIFD
ncbi:prevent-host-death family protein [Sphingomonas zeicaulis]|uniref:type II toxin-antitoxin system Phd/YefM family antitoxin n=1 Tax=Sphingomonas zeicaulis TaxID=1632740 RepID=UPI003D256764